MIKEDELAGQVASMEAKRHTGHKWGSPKKREKALT
jgi:hypothetical protein